MFGLRFDFLADPWLSWSQSFALQPSNAWNVGHKIGNASALGWSWQVELLCLQSDFSSVDSATEFTEYQSLFEIFAVCFDLTYGSLWVVMLFEPAGFSKVLTRSQVVGPALFRLWPQGRPCTLMRQPRVQPGKHWEVVNIIQLLVIPRWGEPGRQSQHFNLKTI